MRKFLSSIVLLVLSLFAVNVSAQTVGEAILGSPSFEYLDAYASQGTYVKFTYPDADESSCDKRSTTGVSVKLYEEGNLVEETSFAFNSSPTYFYGAKFNKVLDRSKNYTVEFGQGCWWMEDAKGNVAEESPVKTFTIEAQAPSLAGEKILGTASISWVKDNWGTDISGQYTFIKFAYPDADESKYYRNKEAGVTAELYEGETLIETSTFGYDGTIWQYGAKFNTILDPSKTYTVKFGEGCWYMSSDEEGENKVEISPAKTFTIEATQGGGGGNGPQVTPWNFTSVTPTEGKVASLNKITVMASGTNLGNITGMTKGVIKCAETNAETNVFFMPNFAGTGLEASFTKITAEGTYTLTIAEGAVTVNGNPNNEFTATWTVGEVTPPTPTTTTLSLDKSAVTLDINDDVTLKATSNVQALINWESSDINVAVVNEQGRVTAKGAGTATITASIQGTDDHTAASATCEVTVNAPAPTGPFASITIGSDVIELSETTPIELYEYPEGAVIKINLSDEAIKGAWYEIKDLTIDEVYKSFADLNKSEDGTYYYAELARTYAMAAGHNYAIHAWFKNKASQLSGTILYEYNFLVKGTNENVPVLSTVSQYESVSPTEDFVLTGVTGTNTIDVRFKGEAPASATAWATVGQGSRQNLTTSIDGNTVHVTVPNSAIAQGVLVLFVQAKDSEGHIIGGGDQSVNPDNGALSWSWLSEVGCEMPQMLEAGTTVDELKTVTFKASDVISLDEGQLVKVGDGEYIRRYNQLQVMDKLGNVIVASVEASQYAESGNNMTLTLKNGIVEAGEYTIVLPYGAFLIGEEMQASSNASGTYVVTVSGALEPEQDNILGEAVFEVTKDEIKVSFPNAKIPADIEDGVIAFPSNSIIVNTPDGTEDTEQIAYMTSEDISLPAEEPIEFVFSNPLKNDAIVVTIPADGINVIKYVGFFDETIVYSNEKPIIFTSTAINAVKVALANGAAYNLAGQKVGANAKGIIIVGGKKVIK